MRSIESPSATDPRSHQGRGILVSPGALLTRRIGGASGDSLLQSLRHGALNLVAGLIELVAFQSGPVNGKRMDRLELRIAPHETQTLERAHVKLKVVPVVLTAASVCIGAERHSDGLERVIHAAQQFHDFFDFAADGVDVYCVARRRYLDADEKLLRKGDFGVCGIYHLAGLESCVQWEVECHCLATDDDRSSLCAINGVQNLVTNDVGKSEDDRQRVRVTDTEQTETVSLRMVALPEVSFEEVMEGMFVYLATKLQGKLDKRPQWPRTVMTPEIAHGCSRPLR